MEALGGTPRQTLAVVNSPTLQRSATELPVREPAAKTQRGRLGVAAVGLGAALVVSLAAVTLGRAPPSERPATATPIHRTEVPAPVTPLHRTEVPAPAVAVTPPPVAHAADAGAAVVPAAPAAVAAPVAPTTEEAPSAPRHRSHRRARHGAETPATTSGGEIPNL